MASDGSGSCSGLGSSSSSDEETDEEECLPWVGDLKGKAVTEEFPRFYSYEVGESSTGVVEADPALTALHPSTTEPSVQKDDSKRIPKLVIKKPKPPQKRQNLQKEAAGPKPFEHEDMPRKMKDHIERELRGRNLFRMSQKTLMATDVDPKQIRLNLPKSNISSLSFLYEGEMETLHDGQKNGLRVVLIDPGYRLRLPSFRSWKSKEDKSGNRSPIYVLTTAVWADIVRINHLREGDEIQIWSFRMLGQLCMALIIVKKAPRSREQRDNQE